MRPVHELRAPIAIIARKGLSDDNDYLTLSQREYGRKYSDSEHGIVMRAMFRQVSYHISLHLTWSCVWTGGS